MCGIFGLVLGEGHGYNGQQVIAAIDQLFRISESRGREAAGLAVVHPDCINVIKSAESASAFLRSLDYNAFAKTLANQFALVNPSPSWDTRAWSRTAFRPWTPTISQS